MRKSAWRAYGGKSIGDETPRARSSSDADRSSLTGWSTQFCTKCSRNVHVTFTYSRYGNYGVVAVLLQIPHRDYSRGRSNTWIVPGVNGRNSDK